MNWGEQIIVVTGGTSRYILFLFANRDRHLLGSSGIGELIANTLAVRNVTVVVLDIKPIITENCMFRFLVV